MVRYLGPKLKITRRLGPLPAFTTKQSSKKNPPGQHGRQNKKPSQYGIRLMEKQKLRYNYGVSEKQLFLYLKKARKNIRSTAEVLLELLEMRLDNIIYRAGFSHTVAEARQLILHKHIKVNNQKITIPSYHCKTGDQIQLTSFMQQKILKNKTKQQSKLPSFITLDPNLNRVQVTQTAARNDLQLELNELLVIEYYSKK